jgi:hypothetical protein
MKIRAVSHAVPSVRGQICAKTDAHNRGYRKTWSSVEQRYIVINVCEHFVRPVFSVSIDILKGTVPAKTDWGKTSR